MQRSVGYILTFAAAVCVVCGVLVSTSAVTLKDRQDANATLERKRNVLQAAGLMTGGESLAAVEIEERFSAIRQVIIDLTTGDVRDDLEPDDFDQQKAKSDPARSETAPDNRAGIKRVPKQALVFEIVGTGGDIEAIVLPIEGLGLWSTLYGFVALDADTRTVRGLTYYDHGETPGLGGEVDNARWKALWPGRQVLGDGWQPEIEVIKGAAGAPADDPHRVDGLSGASITSRGVTEMLRFWLGSEGFGPYLERIRSGRVA